MSWFALFLVAFFDFPLFLNGRIIPSFNFVEFIFLFGEGLAETLKLLRTLRDGKTFFGIFDFSNLYGFLLAIAAAQSDSNLYSIRQQPVW